MTPGSHGSTFGGNPLAAAAGNAVLDVVLEAGFLPHVEQMGLLFKQRLAELADRHPAVIQEIRGEGLMLGLKMAPHVVNAPGYFFAEGLLTVGAGENVVRLLPPLTVSEPEIAEACVKIDAACGRLDGTLTA